MKRKQLVKLLKQNDFTLIRQGKHEIWGKNGMTIPVPRHTEIPEPTARRILQRADIDNDE